MLPVVSTVFLTVFFPPIVFVFITFSIQWFTGSGKDQSVFVLLNGPAWPGARHQNRPIIIIISISINFSIIFTIIFSIIFAVVFLITIRAASILSLWAKTTKKYTFTYSRQPWLGYRGYTARRFFSNLLGLCFLWLVFSQCVSKECDFGEEIDRKIKMGRFSPKNVWYRHGLAP